MQLVYYYTSITKYHLEKFESIQYLRRREFEFMIWSWKSVYEWNLREKFVFVFRFFDFASFLINWWRPSSSFWKLKRIVHSQMSEWKHKLAKQKNFQKDFLFITQRRINQTKTIFIFYFLNHSSQNFKSCHCFGLNVIKHILLLIFKYNAILKD